MSKKFAVFDIDGTVIRWQLYHAIVGQLAKQGALFPELSDEIREARMTWKKRQASDSFSQYERVLVKNYTRAITEISVAEFELAVEEVFETYKDQVYTYTRDLIKCLKAKGYLLFAISGSQQQIIAKFGDYYGFDEVVGSQYEAKDGKFTGKAAIPAIDGKGVILKKLAEKHAVTWRDSIAVGDTKSDVEMLELVEQPIAFNPEQGLLEIATEKGWEIVVERKNVVYELISDGSCYKLRQG